MKNKIFRKLIQPFQSLEDRLSLMMGRQLVWQQPNNVLYLNEAGFSVFSQWDEDGIIQYLIKKINTINNVFIEFGVENYRESNTRFLLQNNNWQGLVIDGNRNNIDQIQNSNLYWRHDLSAVHSFIEKDNITDIIDNYICNRNLSKKIGLLSVDIDGVDYWVLKNITNIEPQIIICEYNSIFGNSLPITVPYDSNFRRTKAHFSNLYFGANLKAFQYLLEPSGYTYIGSSSSRINAFFVKKDLAMKFLGNLKKPDFRPSHVRESRDEEGNLTFLSGHNRRMAIKNLEVVNLENNKMIRISDIVD